MLMPSSALTRAAALLIALGATIALSGCAAALLFVPLPTSAAPVVGDCWPSTFDTAARSSNWSGTPVDCSSGHQLYTYAMATVSSSAPTWKDGSGNLDSSIASAGGSACSAKLAAFLPDIPVGGLLTDFFFMPSEAQWAKGARWVRCDVAQLAIGSLLTTPSFAALGSITDLTARLRDDPQAFASCVLTTDPSGRTGPFDDPKSRYADCGGTHQWSLTTNFTVPGVDGDPYPAQTQIAQVEQTSCGDLAAAAGVGWTAYIPTVEQWDGGFRGGSCWFYTDDTGGTTT
jgi:hypothetical protein